MLLNWVRGRNIAERKVCVASVVKDSHMQAMVMSIVTVAAEFLYLAFCLKDIMSRISVGGG